MLFDSRANDDHRDCRLVVFLIVSQQSELFTIGCPSVNNTRKSA